MSSLVVTMPISPNVLKLVGSLGLLPKKPLCPLYCITQRNHMSVPSNILQGTYWAPTLVYPTVLWITPSTVGLMLTLLEAGRSPLQMLIVESNYSYTYSSSYGKLQGNYPLVRFLPKVFFWQSFCNCVNIPQIHVQVQKHLSLCMDWQDRHTLVIETEPSLTKQLFTNIQSRYKKPQIKIF